jgi:thiamine transporter ThiT
LSKKPGTRSKSLALVGIMGALGNVLAIISISIGMIPSPIFGQVAFDFSNLAVAIVAVYAGWRLGLLTGLIAGLTSGIWFGPLGSLGILGLLGLPLGKALTGLTVGILSNPIRGNQDRRSPLLVIPIVLVGYLPEFVFTIYFFLALVPILIGGATAVYLLLALPIIVVKAWIEMTAISFFMWILLHDRGFSNFIDGYLSRS